jgi:hypothetical protein
MNNRPNMMDIIPIMIFGVEKVIIKDAIPKNIKLNPIKTDTNPVLKIGKIIKINPKIIDNIPDILFDSMFFPPTICCIHFFK